MPQFPPGGGLGRAKPSPSSKNLKLISFYKNKTSDIFECHRHLVEQCDRLTTIVIAAPNFKKYHNVEFHLNYFWISSEFNFLIGFPDLSNWGFFKCSGIKMSLPIFLVMTPNCLTFTVMIVCNL